MADISNCVICNLALATLQTVNITERRRQTLQSASRIRQDNLHRIFRNFDGSVHVNCYNTYTHHKHLQSATSTSASTSQEIAHANIFDFNKLCIICRTDASSEFIDKQKKKPKNRRVEVSLIQTQNTIDNIISTAENINNSAAAELISLLQIINLKKDSGRYHKDCFRKFHLSLSVPSADISSENSSNFVDFIINYIRNNPEECQFSVNEILEHYNGEKPTLLWISRKLSNIDEDIVVTNRKNDCIITHTKAINKILSDRWYDSRSNDLKEERNRILETAAGIILHDIESAIYNTNAYPSLHDFLNNVESDIPESLQFFLNKLVLKKKRSLEKWQKKVTALSHAIISAVRPKSFLSPLLLSLGTLLYKRYGSKDLITILNTLGFSVSYKECMTFEISAILHKQNPNVSQCFSQFVFDNADHNVNTLDGLRTFHVMGGIQCVTPSTVVSDDSPVMRKNAMLSAKHLENVGKIKLLPFQKERSSGLADVEVKDLQAIDPINYEFQLLDSDFLWIYGKNIEHTNVKGWNSFMETLTKNSACDTSRILFLPFVEAPASNYDTIYTVLVEASKRSKALGQSFCIVTFDQPLYWKARDIIASSPNNEDLKNVVVRLGGFHLLMSFLGAIGFIMEGSGIKELFSEAYAPGSIDKMLDGHAYARAVRAHILAHLAIAKIILSDVTFSEEETNFLRNLLQNVEDDSILEDLKSDTFKVTKDKFMNRLNQITTNKPTAQLWVQYFNMVTLVKQFIEAERTGDWNLHIETVKKMLPFFHASGHFLYAKSCQLYLQDMFTLPSILDESDYNKFIKLGYFTIRRTNVFRRGVWTDMTIEQTLMKTMHSSGGITRGRGTTSNVIAKWSLSMPSFFEVSESLLKFCNTSLSTSSEQHVDACDARFKKDSEDANKFVNWLRAHNPFQESADIISVSTGFKGDLNINCHKALQIGLQSINRIIGQDMKNVKFARKNRVLSLRTVNVSTTNKNVNVTINPTLLFQRISLLIKNPNDLKECFNYELAPYPLSIFDEIGMRKTTKSTLYNYFNPVEKTFNCNSIHVLDGGFLLHRVVWHEKQTYDNIITDYVQFVKKYYSAQSIIVFDGYSEDVASKSTKTAERMRRKSKNVCPDYIFDGNMKPPVSQSKFLSNENNKKLFISMLMAKLQESQFLVKQAEEDADSLIVQTALDESKNHESVIIVGQDIDLLVILTQLAPENSNVYFLKPSVGNSDNKLFDCNSFKYPHIKRFIALLHAFTGCDTTSAFYKQGKGKLIDIFAKDENLQTVSRIFYDDKAFPMFIDWAGQKCIMALYGASLKDEVPLNEFRFQCFKKLSQRKNFQLSVLPPTQEAACYHSLRVFYQIKQWTSAAHNFNVEQWGWIKTKNGLLPITSKEKAVPDSIAKVIACKCKKGCSGNCSCKKNGIYCTNLCDNCSGKNCGNAERIPIDFNEDMLNEEEELPAEIITIPHNSDENDDYVETEPLEPEDDCLFANVYDGTDSESESESSLKRNHNNVENGKSSKRIKQNL